MDSEIMILTMTAIVVGVRIIEKLIGAVLGKNSSKENKDRLEDIYLNSSELLRNDQTFFDMVKDERFTFLTSKEADTIAELKRFLDKQ